MTKRHKKGGLDRNRKSSNARMGSAIKQTAQRMLSGTRSDLRADRKMKARKQREAIKKATYKPQTKSWIRRLFGL